MLWTYQWRDWNGDILRPLIHFFVASIRSFSQKYIFHPWHFNPSPTKRSAPPSTPSPPVKTILWSHVLFNRRRWNPKLVRRTTFWRATAHSSRSFLIHLIYIIHSHLYYWFRKHQESSNFINTSWRSNVDVEETVTYLSKVLESVRSILFSFERSAVHMFFSHGLHI